MKLLFPANSENAAGTLDPDTVRKLLALHAFFFTCKLSIFR